MKYDFEFSWESTYGYAAKLVGSHADIGLVLDLGCGLGTFSQPVLELGFEYLGFDHDAESVEECRRRGLECGHLDLRDMDEVRARVLEAVGDRMVTAVALLDVVEHLPDPEEVLAGIASLVDSLATDSRRPLLVLSIPNVSHADLAAKLVFGRWDVTDVGLLDRTHITLFTHDRLVDVVEAAGFIEVGRNDVAFADTEQRFPPDHPAVAHGTPLYALLRSLRLGADPFGNTYQFVRCYQRGTAPAARNRRDVVSARCTVVVATTGEPSLGATLSSLAAQTETQLDVRVVAPADCVGRVSEQLSSQPPSFRDHVHIESVDSRARVEMLNTGLDRATGELVVFATAGDVYRPESIAQLCATAARYPGELVRAVNVPSLPPEAGAPPTSFDLFRHLIQDETPLRTVAIPLVAARALGLRFVDVGDGLEGWYFVARAAWSIGVVDCPTDGPMQESVPSVARAVPLGLPSSTDDEPLVLPAGSLSTLRRALGALAAHDELESQLEIARQRIDALERSRYWRLTAPARRLTSKRPSLAFLKVRGSRGG